MKRREDITTASRPVMCAIYTRVSTLDQAQGEFTSIDNQREMSEAYIKSQGGKNWVAIDEQFDDPGYSAGTVERPALRRLLAAIETGSVDVVVAYRLDRLSRSLSDFMKLIDRFHAAGVAFVSVSESFSTETAVGRLTMGLLATFAEFERASISQRTADKMGAARRRGRWTGGHAPLGYRVHEDGGRLVIDPDEAAMLREIFDCYLRLGSLIAVANELDHRGWVTPLRTTKSGSTYGGLPFTKNRINQILTNATCTGRIEFQGQFYHGEHEAILDTNTFYRVQEMLAANRPNGGARTKNKFNFLLRGLLHCTACGTAMSPSTTRKEGRVFRYYICGHAAKTGWRNCPHPSLPAAQIEDAVVERIKCVGRDPSLVAEVLAQIKSIKQTRQPALIAERRRIDRELHRLLDRSRDEDRDHVAKIEARLLEVSEELAVLQSESIDKRDLAKALSAFTEIWDVLFPAERERIVGLLVERVEFDALQQTVSLTFAPCGIKTLAAEIEVAEGATA